MITSALVKAKYSACLESNFLIFYPSLLTFRPLAGSQLSFQVRLCPDLLIKKNELKTSTTTIIKPSFNPFLPFDKNLWVADLKTPSHVLIFNKYCVILEHLLVITREFIPQAAPFCKEDFDAVEEVLTALDGEKSFAFFNSGPEAGASQGHRHFQVISTEGKGAIVEEAIKASPEPAGTPFTVPCFESFKHACIKIDPKLPTIEAFSLLKSSLSFADNFAFNLIWSREWMLLVPRRKEFTNDGINSLNALAFAGYVLVMDESHLLNLDVLSALQQVTFS